MEQSNEEMSGKMRTWIAVFAILIPLLLSWYVKNF